MLELRALSRRYGQTVALDGLSLTVPEGEVVGFVGPNGSGKTTAMRIALGVLEADDGQVLWGGAPATREQQRLFGYLPEERGLYPKMRVDRHLRYLASLHGRDDAEAEQAATRWIERLGLSERAEQRVEELSLGKPAARPARCWRPFRRARCSPGRSPGSACSGCSSSRSSPWSDSRSLRRAARSSWAPATRECSRWCSSGFCSATCCGQRSTRSQA